jgi:hypothetical protein
MPAKHHSHPLESASNSRAAVTEAELLELIEETALLHAKRRRRPLCTLEDWSEARAEVMERLGFWR